MSPAWLAHIFGGSSLADAACFRQVAEISRGQTGAKVAVVVSAVVVGAGLIGGTFFEQLRAQTATLKRERQIDSKRMHLSEGGETPEVFPADLERFVAHVHPDHIPHAVLIDCGGVFADLLRLASYLGGAIA